MMKSEELIERFRKEYLTNMEYDELKDLYDYINYNAKIYSFENIILNTGYFITDFCKLSNLIISFQNINNTSPKLKDLQLAIQSELYHRNIKKKMDKNKKQEKYLLTSIRIHDITLPDVDKLIYGKAPYYYDIIDKEHIQNFLNDEYVCRNLESGRYIIKLDFLDISRAESIKLKFGFIYSKGIVRITKQFIFPEVQTDITDFTPISEPVKKVFISVPFKNRKDKDILISIEKMHKLAEEKFGQKLEPVHNFFIPGDSNEIIAPEGSNKSLYYLSEAIKKISQVDYFIGVQPCARSRGCSIETSIVANYNIPYKIISFSETVDVLSDMLFDDVLRRIDNEKKNH